MDNTLKLADPAFHVTSGAPTRLVQPIVPPFEDYTKHVHRAWAGRWFTNFGPLHSMLTDRLVNYLAAPNMTLCSSGTIALAISLMSMIERRKLDPSGPWNVVTTALTFPATINAITMAGVNVRLADIDYETLNLDAKQVAPLMDEYTVGVVGVPLFGRCGGIENLSAFCAYNGLDFVLDAAHCFNVYLQDRPLHTYADFTALSYHATKLFHCGEGGGIIADSNKDAAIAKIVSNFGISAPDRVTTTGLNGKMSELHAAMGLSVLPLVDEEKKRRAILRSFHRDLIRDISESVELIDLESGETSSEQYLVLKFLGEKAFYRRNLTFNMLKDMGIETRKYFNPIATSYVSNASRAWAGRFKCPNAQKAADGLLAVPHHSRISRSHIEQIYSIIKQVLKEV